jgi:hypothetical protein
MIARESLHVEKLHSPDAPSSYFLIGILSSVTGDNSTTKVDSKASHNPPTI